MPDTSLNVARTADASPDGRKLVGEYTEEAVSALFQRAGFIMERLGIEHLFRRHLDIVQADRNADPSASSKIAYEHQRDFVDFLRSFPDFVAFRSSASINNTTKYFQLKLSSAENDSFQADLQPFGFESKLLIYIRNIGRARCSL